MAIGILDSYEYILSYHRRLIFNSIEKNAELRIFLTWCL
jgi:hypothetical protein